MLGDVTRGDVPPWAWRVAMPTPLRSLLGLVFVLALAASACGDDDDAIDETFAEQELPAEEDVDAPSSDEDQPDEASVASAELPTDLEVGGVSFDTGVVFIINTGDTPVDLSGFWVCNRPDYAQLPPIELGPSEGIEFEFPSVDSSGGEAAIYASDDFSRSEGIISYVHWGDGGGRADLAEAAGQWSGRPVEVSGEGIFLLADPGTAAAWEE